MKLFGLLPVSCLFCLALAAPALAQGGKHNVNSHSALSGCVTFRNNVDDSIKSDALFASNGDYCDGEDGVGIGVGVRGGHRFDTNNADRTVVLEFPGLPDCENCPGDGGQDVDIRIGNEYDQFGLTDHRLNLIEIEEGEVHYAALSIVFVPAGERPQTLQYRLQFGTELDSPATHCDNVGNDPAQVKVTRLPDAVGKRVWTIESAGNACLWEITDHYKVHRLAGRFAMPFLYTITEQ